ncbi:hypothetical protein E2K80_18240 [Rhodophyticola sp. CCM32]|uniref:hypothetical protein n=1 Tax=Rhodophyticola sp. CCM32 TaxID=2916397 RepID=UPI00107F3804|nr:hypothetical protein [Rhodophyticola sp. CCM32]QBY02442.1 hypothetical protein E2K80_18240 [Rhodophyticola sp. CCM32]
MPRITLHTVVYDARRQGFLALAKLEDTPLPRHLACFWPGPRKAGFAQISQGLTQAALRQTD